MNESNELGLTLEQRLAIEEEQRMAEKLSKDDLLARYKQFLFRSYINENYYKQILKHGILGTK